MSALPRPPAMIRPGQHEPFDPALLTAEALAHAPEDIRQVHAWLSTHAEAIADSRQADRVASAGCLSALTGTSIIASLGAASVIGASLAIPLVSVFLVIPLLLVAWAVRSTPELDWDQVTWAETTLRSWAILHKRETPGDIASAAPLSRAAAQRVARVQALSDTLPEVQQAALAVEAELHRIEAEQARILAMVHEEPSLLSALSRTADHLRAERERLLAGLAELYGAAAAHQLRAAPETEQALQDALLQIAARPLETAR